MKVRKFSAAKFAMVDLKGFDTQRVPVDDGTIFVRVGGAGPPLLLLHGFPQTHVCWARIAPYLAQEFTVVLADLTGYGNSRGPMPAPDGSNYSKRVVAKQMVDCMRALGHDRFAVVGHDRGARVAYRLALDHPSSVKRLAALSILPTFAAWRRLADVEKAINTYHWFLLAQKPPIPNDVILAAPDKMVRNTIASWTGSGTLAGFDEAELGAYAAALANPESVDAICAEYRAAWTTDRRLDEADVEAARKIGCPTLLLWGADEYDDSEMRPAWASLAPEATFVPLQCGHFVTEEATAQTLKALLDFMR